ncbi:hypothetical protein [Corynebacterium bovis]|uniref:hypothetical protein n=1 Tax=Corynebacterium bovis TaxID=36808 RepID=UPI000F647B1B|nr:hypothetical protein [Corynebacterium bovis]RRQ14098.1 hypothetical protein CXF46_11060 [Corynebacterium bovis]
MTDAQAAGLVASTIGGVVTTVCDIYDVHPFAAACLVGRACEHLSEGRARELDAKAIDTGQATSEEIHHVLIAAGRMILHAPQVLQPECNPDSEIAYAAGTGTPIRDIVTTTGLPRREITDAIDYAWDETRITDYWLTSPALAPQGPATSRRGGFTPSPGSPTPTDAASPPATAHSPTAHAAPGPLRP